MECPLCKETIQDGAIKCRHCNTMLNQVQPDQTFTKQASCPSAGSESGYNMFDWYKKVLTNYVVFNGRARRKEYWYFMLANLIVAFVLGIIGGVVGKGALLYNIYNLAIFLPSLAVAIRRLHDGGRSGWWILLPLVNLIMLLQDSTQGSNKYGPNPKMATC